MWMWCNERLGSGEEGIDGGRGKRSATYSCVHHECPAS